MASRLKRRRRRTRRAGRRATGRRSAPTVPSPGEDVGEGVERRVPRQRPGGRPGATVAWAIVIGVCVPPGPTWPAMSPAIRRTSAPPSGDDSSTDSSASRFWYRGAVILSFAGRLTHSWMPWNSAAADDELLGRRLDVQDARAGGHPLRGAVRDEAAAAVGVLVLERPVDDVGDGLEAAVRVPVGALGLVRGVVDLAHLVHVDERVEVLGRRRRRTPGARGSPRPRSRTGRS